MNSCSHFRVGVPFVLGALALAQLALPQSCPTVPVPPAPAAPSNFTDLYSLLNTDLAAFNATLATPAPYPVLYAGNLINANANTGPQLAGASYLTGIQLEIQAWKAN